MQAGWMAAGAGVRFALMKAETDFSSSFVLVGI
jgi:hypothetical protein